MSKIHDEGISLICGYNLAYNRRTDRSEIDYKQFSRELRKFYSTTNYACFTAGVLDEVLEDFECKRISKRIQRRSAWVADFVTRFAILISRTE